MWEPRELIKILSTERNKTTIDRECYFCRSPLPKGEVILSAGIVDRMTESKERIYLCDGCEQYFGNNSTEDEPEHVQRLLHENRFIDEVWFND